MDPKVAWDATAWSPRTSLPQNSRRLGATGMPQFQPPAPEDAPMGPPQAADAPPLSRSLLPKNNPALDNQTTNDASTVDTRASKIAPSNYKTTNILDLSGDKYSTMARKTLVSGPNRLRDDAYLQPTPVQPRSPPTPFVTHEAPPSHSFPYSSHSSESPPPTPPIGFLSDMAPPAPSQRRGRDTRLAPYGRSYDPGEQQTQPERPFICDQCPKLFTHSIHLHIHNKVHFTKQERRFNCYQCPRSFIGLRDLERHKKIHLSLNPFPSVLTPPLRIPTPPSGDNQPVWRRFPDVLPGLGEPAVPSSIPTSSQPLASNSLAPPKAKAETPLTDSGYGSAIGLAPHVHTMGHEPADDSQTEYSDATIVPKAHARSYINELCHDISSRLGPQACLSGKNTSLLPALVKALAIKIASYQPSQVHRDVMYFIYKHHKELTQQLNDILSRDGDQKAPDHLRDTSDGMQIWEKMDMWHTARGSDIPPKGDNDEPFEGVDDEDAELAVSLSTYNDIVLSSPAYEWFIASIKRECGQSSLALRDTASRILSRFSTARISKNRVPDKHRASFILSWQSMADRVRLQCPQVKSFPESVGLLSGLIALTSSSDDELQATVVGEYLHQIWPSLGPSLLGVVDAAVREGSGASMGDTLADKTEVQVECGPVEMRVDVMGTAYSIAECGEQLSWLACAIRVPPADSAVRTTPILSSLPDIISSRGVPSACFRIDVRQEDIPSSQLQGRCWYRAVENSLFPVFTQGFPTAWRPEGGRSLDLSYFALVEAFGRIPNHAPFRLERGPMRLKLVDRIGRDVFYWHDTSLPGGYGHCGGSSPEAPRYPPSDITISDLRSGHHILCPFVGMQSDIAEKDRDGESPLATDESLSLGLVSDAGDSQTTEEPAEMSPAYDLFKQVLRRLVVEFQGESNISNCTGSSPANTADKGTRPPDTTPSSSVNPSHCTGRKWSPRASGDKDDEDDEDDESPPRKKPKTRGSPCARKSALLACPFWKLDPNKHWGCYAKRLTTISYIKQHLSRNHTPAYYCQRCFTIFQDADTYDDHVTADPPCMRGPSARLEGISPAQSKRLQRRAKGSVEDQWFAIWDIVFPRDRRPSFVYMDYDQSEDFVSFHQFIRRKGVSIVRDELQASGIVSASADAEGRPLDRAIERALEGLFERFRSDRLSYSATSSMPQTAGQHTEPPTQDEVMVSSSATDSGVGVSSVFSSGGSGAGDEAPHQPTSIANPFARPPPHSSGQPQGLVTMNQPGETDEMFRSLFDESGGAGFTDDLFGGDGEDRLLWDDFVRECNK